MSFIEERITHGDDGFGTIWYDFYNMPLVKAMDWIKNHGLEQYDMADIKVWKKFWFFGKIIRIHVVLNKYTGPSRQISEFYSLLKWVKGHGKGHTLELTTDNYDVFVTLRDLDGHAKYRAQINPEEFKEHYNTNGRAMYFLNELWDKLHSGKRYIPHEKHHYRRSTIDLSGLIGSDQSE